MGYTSENRFIKMRDDRTATHGLVKK